MQSQQNKNSKFQELVVEENSNWNLMDQEKERVILEHENQIDELKSALNSMQKTLIDRDQELQETKA